MKSVVSVVVVVVGWWLMGWRWRDGLRVGVAVNGLLTLVVLRSLQNYRSRSRVVGVSGVIVWRVSALFQCVPMEMPGFT